MDKPPCWVALLMWMDEPTLILDVRCASAFEASRAAGSVNIPHHELTERLFELPPKETPLQVIYDVPSRDALEVLMRAGWRHIRPCGVDGVHLSESHPAGDRLWQPCEYLHHWACHIESRVGGPGLALDVGCGCGRDAAYLAKRGWRVVGIENRIKLATQSRILSASQRSSQTTSVGFNDPIATHVKEWLPFRLGCFDLVLCVRFLHRPLLGKLKSYVAKGGYVLYSHFVDGVQHVGTPKHVSGYLLRGELSETLCCGTGCLSLVDEGSATLADGRPIVNFLAQRS